MFGVRGNRVSGMPKCQVYGCFRHSEIPSTYSNLSLTRHIEKRTGVYS